ncbi:hypothetical protein BKA70DRAFT_1435851 [Coprinopsis sp. MPI-PUGE-AT-0042]|nr:hypothetical protein BKA70DRAFT_1435851 [Coprinopsis sp. MPI-PUGE-AT-0042]
MSHQHRGAATYSKVSESVVPPRPQLVGASSSRSAKGATKAKASAKAQGTSHRRPPPAVLSDDEVDEEEHLIIEEREDDNDDSFAENPSDVESLEDEDEDIGDDDLEELSKLGKAEIKRTLANEATTFQKKQDPPAKKSRRRLGTELVTNSDSGGDDDESPLVCKTARKAPATTTRAAARRQEVPQFATPAKATKMKESLLSPVFDNDEDTNPTEDEDPDVMPDLVGGVGRFRGLSAPGGGPLGPPGGNGGGVIGANESQWPESTRLVPPPRGVRNLRIKEQQPAVRATIATAITDVIGGALFSTPFPSVAYNYRLQRKALRKAAELLGHTEIADRITRDSDYGVILARLLIQHLTNFRGNAKQEAMRKVEAHYGLIGEPQDIMKVVQKEIKDLHFVYPLAGKGPNRNFTQPFMHSGIVSTLRQIVFAKSGARSTSLAQKYESSFREVTIGGVERKAVSDAMVCFSATMVYAALDDWKGGDHHPANFNADVYEDVYQTMIPILDTIRPARDGAAYDYLMARLYTECRQVLITSFVFHFSCRRSSFSRGVDHATIATSDGAIQLLDIANMPVGDAPMAGDDA